MFPSSTACSLIIHFPFSGSSNLIQFCLSCYENYHSFIACSLNLGNCWVHLCCLKLIMTRPYFESYWRTRYLIFVENFALIVKNLYRFIVYVLFAIGFRCCSLSLQSWPSAMCFTFSFIRIFLPFITLVIYVYFFHRITFLSSPMLLHIS